jgi:hypothetical protein
MRPDDGLPPTETEGCERVSMCDAMRYWRTPLQERTAKWRWLEDHAMECFECAIVLEEAACRGTDSKSWSPRGEIA